jgi:hypothetical protein
MNSEYLVCEGSVHIQNPHNSHIGLFAPVSQKSANDSFLRVCIRLEVLKSQVQLIHMKKEEHMRLSYMVQLAVLVMTVLAGTGFALSLIFLFWELTDPYRTYLDRSLYYVGFSGALTLVGLIILSLMKRSQKPPAQIELGSANEKKEG